jgi:hypothetical protein
MVRGQDEVWWPVRGHRIRLGAFARLHPCPVVGRGEGEGADRQDYLAAPLGYRAELRRTSWALDRVSKDGTVVWVRTAESGCNRFHHVRVRQVFGGFRLVAFDVVYIPTKKRYGCRLYLLRHRHHVELPRPLGGDKIPGECIPRDPRETCALLHALIRTREGAPERDPWLADAEPLPGRQPASTRSLRGPPASTVPRC